MSKNQIDLRGSNYVQVGDNNVQNVQIQIAVFKELIAKIDACSAPPAQKAAAKSKLSAFLEHPVVVAVAGGLARGVFGSTK